MFFFFFFFFQAEDGIRDLYVTGVQTCALPILPSSPQENQTPISASGAARRPRSFLRPRLIGIACWLCRGPSHSRPDPQEDLPLELTLGCRTQTSESIRPNPRRDVSPRHTRPGRDAALGSAPPPARASSLFPATRVPAPRSSASSSRGSALVRRQSVLHGRLRSMSCTGRRRPAHEPQSR